MKLQESQAINEMSLWQIAQILGSLSDTQIEAISSPVTGKRGTK